MRLDLNIELLYQKCDRNAKRIAKSAQLFILFLIVQKILIISHYENFFLLILHSARTLEQAYFITPFEL